jgi:succinate dehydrogenase/fumarate reductase flavoprotein subunit
MKGSEEMKEGLSRRAFLKTTSVGVSAAALTGFSTTSASAAEHSIKWDYEADVVVVGYGGAGVVAAITAHDAGAKVLVLEKSPSLASLGITDGKVPAQQISGGGGNSHICMGQFCSPKDAEGAANYLYAGCGGNDAGGSLTPMEICRAWAEEMVKNKAWADEMGIKAVSMGNRSEYSHFPGYSSMYVYQTTGYGQAWFKVLDDQAKKRGIQILFDTPGKELIQDPKTKAIIGVKAKSGEKEISIKAGRGVILSTGGFEFNEKLKNKFFKAYPMKFYGWGYNTGDGISMAQKVGADIGNMGNLCGGNCTWFPDDPANVGHSASPMTNNYIWVDKFGKRFVNEMDSRINPHKGWMMFTQFDNARATYPYIPHYLIFDETARLAGPLDSFGAMGGPPVGAPGAAPGGGAGTPPAGGAGAVPMGGGGVAPMSGTETKHKLPTMGREVLPAALGGVESWSKDNSVEIQKGWIKKGETLEELAKAIGSPMDAATLKASVEAFNAYCDAKEDKEFGRNSRMLAPIRSAPFYAVPLYPGLVCTEGGPAVNAKFQVVDPDGNPIPHLYTAGTNGSVVTRVYSVTGGNLGSCMASGRITGRNAAAEKPWG